MADKNRREGGGKSPTKFMERPGSKPEKKEDDFRKEESHPEFIEDDLDALERQETYDEEVSKPDQDVSKPGHKGDEKPDPRKYQDPAKTDVGPERGDTAC
jgi:hypothetical protein